MATVVPVSDEQRRPRSDDGPAAAGLSRRLVGAVLVGTLLNPLNSSMIAVALVGLSAALGVGVASATWLVTVFYLGGAVGMPLMGRLADRFGPRRIFVLGLVLVGLSSVLAALAASFGWLLLIRVVQAFGTSAAYPAGLAMFRARDARGRAPAAALGAVSIASSVSAALGPVLGGGLVTLGGWPAIFLVNVPWVGLGLLLAWRWLPADPPRVPAGRAGGDAGGDVRRLLGHRALLGVFAQFAVVNVVFYGVFFGLPVWLEQARGAAPSMAGLLLLPVAGVGVLATPLAARLIDRSGPRPALLIGGVLLLVGSLLLLVFDTGTSVPVLLLVGAVLGVPNGFNNLGLQAALYEAAPAEQIGAAGGLFQTCRYGGAMAATVLIGLILGEAATSAALHTLALIMAALSLLVVARAWLR